jgi:hypothetical protein
MSDEYHEGIRTIDDYEEAILRIVKNSLNKDDFVYQAYREKGFSERETYLRSKEHFLELIKTQIKKIDEILLKERKGSKTRAKVRKAPKKL